MSTELDHIDESIGRWCRRTARVEQVGPFEVFVEPAPFAPKYARPIAGRRADADDVAALVARQAELRLPLEVEGVHECHPWLAAELVADGWAVVEAPLMVHRAGRASASAGEFEVREVRWDDATLARVDSIGHVAFSSPGMAISAVGVAQAREVAETHDPASNRERLRRGEMVMMAAIDAGEAVAYGSLLLDDAAPFAEVVAVGTLPSHRRRGFGGAITRALVDEARRRGVETVWLSAADGDVASLYGELGFEAIGTYVIASVPSAGDLVGNG